jgi:histidinol-phosphatase (PHP family)
MPLERLPEYIQRVGEAAEHGKSLGVEVLLGIEAEGYFDEEPLREMDQTLSSAPFDFVLGSLHHHCPGYTRMFSEEELFDDVSRTERYFEDLIRGVYSNRYDSIAHPDVIRDYGGLNRFPPEDFEPLIRRFLQALLETDTCMEINTSGLIKNSFEVHPHPRILDWAAEMGIPLTLGSDAHNPGQVAQYFPRVLNLLQQKGFEELNFFRKRVRQTIPLKDWNSQLDPV